MPTMLFEVPPGVPNEAPVRKRWTRAELQQVEDAGVFAGQHWELIEGELISKMGKKRPHSSALRYVVVTLSRIFGELYIQHEVNIDVAPQDNPTSEPEPDVVVTRGLPHEYAKNPGPADIRLLAEVADSSLGFDTGAKGALYARAGISEYWVLDVRKRRLLVFRDPVEGRFHSIAQYGDTEFVVPAEAPAGASILVADLFGPPVPEPSL